jgi:[acyl-carrier-protein] S-malonyltransferase
MVAYLFAGQGSQYVGMGKDLYESFLLSRKIFDTADTALGFDLKRKCFEGPQDLLKPTNISQPAILTATIAAYQAFQANLGSKIQAPAFYAGLSLGEYSALIAAGSITFEDGLRLVRKRAEIMNEASRKYPGKMAAVIGLPVKEIKEICSKSGAEIANLNSPDQTVISGRPEAIDIAKEKCIAAGAKRVIELEVSGAFHSSLMFEASSELKEILDNVSISPISIPVVSNYTASPEYHVTQVRENLVRQMYSPVRWEESIRFMLSEGVTQFVEFGPGKVLKGLLRKIDPSIEVVGIEKKEDILSFNLKGGINAA